ncbi:hypothetical protein GCM10011390_42040 [Aureimonas endophytica]|uniref:Uncharacterized protein n=1 Tax=Aureimonas endophytica TaxID=2027858 RepID=A0A916ZZ25_9HYPH|nr:hypothetical protein [Aureimonas endophytica]GGE18456.1 hypothetical protein GCM10011390_42040 [Aureimonas endophytica]
MATEITFKFDGGKLFGEVQPARIPYIKDGLQFGMIEAIGTAEIEVDHTCTSGFSVTLVELHSTVEQRILTVWPIDDKHDLFGSIVAYLEAVEGDAIRDLLAEGVYTNRALGRAA